MEYRSSPSIAALRNIAITFVVMTLFLLGFVIYTTLSRASVSVTLRPVDREVNFRLTLAEEALGRGVPSGALKASFLETTASATDTFVPSGTTARTGKAGGTVTIHNETDRPQPLVATTRLLNPAGLLFRLTEPVRVPAQGTVDALVEADKEGAEYEITATSRFTIPGLNSALQQSIYASSSAPMARGGAAESTVTAQDLETARQTLKAKLLDEARQAFTAQVGENKITPDDFTVETLEETASVKAGVAARSFTVGMKLRIIGVVFNREELLRRVADEVGADVSGDTGLRYRIEGFDAISRTAELTGLAVVGSSLDRSSSIFGASSFAGKTPAEVKFYLENFEGVEKVEVQVSPYWQRRLPRLPSRIKVEVK